MPITYQDEVNAITAQAIFFNENPLEILEEWTGSEDERYYLEEKGLVEIEDYNDFNVWVKEFYRKRYGEEAVKYAPQFVLDTDHWATQGLTL
ncbi:hypothetical protein [Gallibacterium anatis]|uniref:hypothetical protein n=1 Tax=Gallibacterium anatis TaxID=750 RepID=UPI003004078D